MTEQRENKNKYRNCRIRSEATHSPFPIASVPTQMTMLADLSVLWLTIHGQLYAMHFAVANRIDKIH